MATPGILIFESDLDFANSLGNELSRRGCNVSVVSDANEGLEQATTRRPDLILLCTELPRMNGFSVCNRLKRDPGLENVPVIIMSANASEETFQQHRNLTKKRAQDYVHKPIGIDEMVGRVSKFIDFSGQIPQMTEAALEELDAEEIEEMDEEAAAQLGFSDNPEPTLSQPAGSERSLAELTDDVFEALVSDARPSRQPSSAPPFAAPGASSTPAPASVGPASVAPASVAPASVAPASVAPASVAPASGRSPDTRPPVANLSRTPRPAQVAVGQSNPPSYAPAAAHDFTSDSAAGATLASDRVVAPVYATELEATAGSEPPPSGRRSSRSPRRSSRSPYGDEIPTAGRVPAISEPLLDADGSSERVQELEHSLVETRARLESVYQELEAAKAKESSGAARAHEILDLREALNRKDKELLELRDELTRRDKELLAANSNALDFERKNTELREQFVELEKRAHAAERAQQAAAQDREQANKRADGYKRKSEKVGEDLELLRVQYTELEEVERQVQERAEQLEASLTETQGKLTDAVRRADDLQADLNDAEKELASLEAQAEATQGRLAEAEQRVRATEQQLDESQVQLSEARDRLEQLRVAQASVRELLGHASRQLDELG